MPREYRHIKMYEKEIFELREQGLSQRQIAEKLGFPYEKIHDFFRRHNRNQRKLAAGIAIKPKGRPRKDGAQLPPSVQQLSKLTQLQYELAGIVIDIELKATIYPVNKGLCFLIKSTFQCRIHNF